MLPQPIPNKNQIGDFIDFKTFQGQGMAGMKIVIICWQRLLSHSAEKEENDENDFE
jgi:hypothetical protein